jgi:uncharacterized coiled-coil protein SlyX
LKGGDNLKESFAIDNQIFDLTEINPLIVKYKVAIASADFQANGFYFSKSLLSTLFNTIKGSPVLTYYDENSNIFAGHEGDVYRSKTGLKRTPTTIPVGFAAYDEDSVFWQTLNLDGTDREWLCACVYLWKDRYPYVDDLTGESVIANQSMELEMVYEMKNGVKVVTEAEFNAITIIGITPAFAGSCVLNFSKQDFSKDILQMKQQLTNITKYSSIDFSIPSEIKEFCKTNLSQNNNQIEKITSVCKTNINYLLNNDYITSNMMSYIQKYFSSIKDKKTFSLNGENVVVEWCNNLISQMREVDKGGEKLNMSQTEEFSKDEWGSGDYKIKVNKNKNAVSNKAWGDVDKTALMHQVIKATNGKSVVNDIYADVEDGYEDAPSKHLKFPIMEVNSDNEAVYNSNALSSALAYANNSDTGNPKVAKKIEGIQKDLDLLKEGEKNNMTKTKMTKAQKSEFSAKFSLSANQIISLMNDACDSQTYDTDYGTNDQYNIYDFDDTYMYGYDCQNSCTVAIPFTIADDGTITPDFDNVQAAKNASIWVVSGNDDYANTDDDDTYSMFANAKCAKVESKMTAKITESETKMSEVNNKLSETEAKLTDTEAKLGKQFAATTSLETALADAQTTCAERQTEIDNLSAQLKGKEDNEVLTAAKALMSKKEFKVFTEDVKAEILKFAVDKTPEEFETIALAKLGKFAAENFEYDLNTGKFSTMFVPNINTQKPNNNDLADDPYAEARKKFGIENK